MPFKNNKVAPDFNSTKTNSLEKEAEAELARKNERPPQEITATMTSSQRGKRSFTSILLAAMAVIVIIFALHIHTVGGSVYDPLFGTFLAIGSLGGIVSAAMIYSGNSSRKADIDFTTKQLELTLVTIEKHIKSIEAAVRIGMDFDKKTIDSIANLDGIEKSGSSNKRDTKYTSTILKLLVDLSSKAEKFKKTMTLNSLPKTQTQSSASVDALSTLRNLANGFQEDVAQDLEAAANILDDGREQGADESDAQYARRIAEEEDFEEHIEEVMEDRRAAMEDRRAAMSVPEKPDHVNKAERAIVEKRIAPSADMQSNSDTRAEASLVNTKPNSNESEI